MDLRVEVIQDSHLVSLLHKLGNQVRAYEPRPASHKNSHRLSAVNGTARTDSALWRLLRPRWDVARTRTSAWQLRWGRWGRTRLGASRRYGGDETGRNSVVRRHDDRNARAPFLEHE